MTPEQIELAQASIQFRVNYLRDLVRSCPPGQRLNVDGWSRPVVYWQDILTKYQETDAALETLKERASKPSKTRHVVEGRRKPRRAIQATDR